MPRLFVHAINVYRGGGAVLLCYLLRAIPPDVETIVPVDKRMGVTADLPDHVSSGASSRRCAAGLRRNADLPTSWRRTSGVSALAISCPYRAEW